MSNFAPKAAGQSVQALVPEGSPGVAISTSPLPAQPAATEIEIAKPVHAAQTRRNQKPEEAPLAETKPRSPPPIQPHIGFAAALFGLGTALWRFNLRYRNREEYELHRRWPQALLAAQAWREFCCGDARGSIG